MAPFIHQWTCFCAVFVVVMNVMYMSSARSPYHIESKLSWNGTHVDKSLASSTPWDFLTLSLSWTQTFCTLQRDMKVACEIPSDVNDLTIHGLWPSSSSKYNPESCNKTWKFNFDEIKDLESKMVVEWPNVFPNKSEDSLWQHEWEKHGTCAASLPALYGEHNYFGKTLTQKEKYDLLKMLQSYGIEPSDTTQYQYDDVLNALAKALNVKAYLECYIPLEKPDVFYISEIRLCMDKQFSLIDCTKSSSMLTQRENQPCTSEKPLMLPPIKH